MTVLPDCSLAIVTFLLTMPAPTYIISRVADPIFAVFIGVAAAATRINREETAKGRTGGEIIQTGMR